MLCILLIARCVLRFLPSGHTLVGFAMYYFTYDPWIGKLLYLEDFYVMKEFRGTKFTIAPRYLVINTLHCPKDTSLPHHTLSDRGGLITPAPCVPVTCRTVHGVPAHLAFYSENQFRPVIYLTGVNTFICYIQC